MTIKMLEDQLAELLKGKGLGRPRSTAQALIREGRDDHWSLASMSRALGRAIPPEPFYDYVLSHAYPENDRRVDLATARDFPLYLRIYRLLAEYDQTVPSDDFSGRHPFALLTEEEMARLPDQEYERFIEGFKKDHIYEIMKLSREVFGYNTLDHVQGVHFVAMHLARQFVEIGFDVDLGRVSGAAAGHDIGKYGVLKKDSRRVPYLHYWYSDIWFKKHDIHYIRNIAVNHSTWDLELENLSMESLILIYADFRVKNLEGADQPRMHIYPLDESFDVILNKLDNVDESKRQRYQKVYNKLHDFEDYMVAVGIHTDPYSKDPAVYQEIYRDDLALSFGSEISRSLKLFAVSHNTRIMYLLRDEKSLAGLLEEARSSSSMQDLREYVRVFDEYTTYLTQKQKIQTLEFLQEIVTHPEDDIRLNAIRIIGELIANYDEDYRKELPDGVVNTGGAVRGPDLFQDMTEQLIHPPAQSIETHRHMLGYSLSHLMSALFPKLPKTSPEYIAEFSDIFMDYFKQAPAEEEEASLFLLEAAKFLPKDARRQTQPVVAHFLAQGSRWQIILCLEMLAYFEGEDMDRTEISPLLSGLIHRDELGRTVTQLLMKVSVKYLTAAERHTLEELLKDSKERVPIVFLSNLKSATHWSLKRNQLYLLLYFAITRDDVSTLNTAIHFCNLIKVSAFETVRRSAGNAILKLLPHLTSYERNEVAVELLRALEIEGQRFTEYIPHYLGRTMLYLEDRELSELIDDMESKIKTARPVIKSLILMTVGTTLEYYKQFRTKYEKEHTDDHISALLGILISALADPHPQVRHAAMSVIGRKLFESTILSLDNKAALYAVIAKKIVVLMREQEADPLTFMSNAAAFAHIYRFMGEYEMERGDLAIRDKGRYAFFSGSFDPFTLSHKAIALLARDMGYEVYIAVDEFSWSKKTLPNKVRRQIISMSISGEEGLYLFPQSIPVNLASDADISRLKRRFNDQVTVLLGSDVVLNASAYQKDSAVRRLPHIVFLRNEPKQNIDRITSRLGSYAALNLPDELKTISSSQIREYIDESRDISTLIDPLAQEYIYENGFYQKTPIEKQLARFNNLQLVVASALTDAMKNDLSRALAQEPRLEGLILDVLAKPSGQIMVLKDFEQGAVIGLVLVHLTKTSTYLDEAGDVSFADTLRHTSQGRLATIDYAWIGVERSWRNYHQILLTEVLSNLIARDYEYCLFNPKLPIRDEEMAETLHLFNFTRYRRGDSTYHLVNMGTPVILNLDVENVIKEPFRSSRATHEAVIRTRRKLQASLGRLFQGQLILPLEPLMLHQEMIRKITRENGVPLVETAPRTLGPYMCVPYGDLLDDYIVPNTVTKALHTEKYFEPDLKSFTVKELPFYLNLKNQVQTLKSFQRDLILVDTITHKGYRMNALTPLLKKEDLKVRKIISGIVSARGRDLMESWGYEIDSVYYLPRLDAWFNENQLYPFLGGDALWRGRFPERNLLPSINLILPYTAPSFLSSRPREAINDLSIVCHENALELFTVIEQQYNAAYGRKLTLKNLGQVITVPRAVDQGEAVHYDLTQSPSTFLRNSLESLLRLKYLIHPKTSATGLEPK